MRRPKRPQPALELSDDDSGDDDSDDQGDDDDGIFLYTGKIPTDVKIFESR